MRRWPPLPVRAELARDVAGDDSLADAIRERLRAVLAVQTWVELVPRGTLRRSE